MKANQRWSDLRWRHPLWELLRFYCSLRGERTKSEWLAELKRNNSLQIGGQAALSVSKEHVVFLLQYLNDRQIQFDRAFEALRSEDQAIAFCERLGALVGRTATKSRDHHQSSKSLVAAVSAIASNVCNDLDLSIDPDPQKRCVWCSEHGLHVTARNLDGAIPGLANPIVVWEIKEYWGKTNGGSKMSDAVYECNLVGRELREFEELSGIRVHHVVFVDGKEQWGARRSDLARFIDLMNQGLIDHLFVGSEMESEWESLLRTLLR